MSTLLAQITNPAVPVVNQATGNSGQIGASVLGRYIGILIPTAIIVGGMAVLLYLILGAIQWITAAGDKGKVEKARERMVQAVIGLVVLSSVVAIANFLGPIFGFDLLQLNFVNQIQETSRSSGQPTGVRSNPGSTSGNRAGSLTDPTGRAGSIQNDSGRAGSLQDAVQNRAGSLQDKVRAGSLN